MVHTGPTAGNHHLHAMRNQAACPLESMVPDHGEALGRNDDLHGTHTYIAAATSQPSCRWYVVSPDHRNAALTWPPAQMTCTGPRHTSSTRCWLFASRGWYRTTSGCCLSEFPRVGFARLCHLHRERNAPDYSRRSTNVAAMQPPAKSGPAHTRDTLGVVAFRV